MATKRRTAITYIELYLPCTDIAMYIVLYYTRLHLSTRAHVANARFGVSELFPAVSAVERAAPCKGRTNLSIFASRVVFAPAHVFVPDASQFQPCFIRQRIRAVPHPTWIITMPSAFLFPCLSPCDCILRSCANLFCVFVQSSHVMEEKKNVHTYLTCVVVWSYAGGISVDDTLMLYS